MEKYMNDSLDGETILLYALLVVILVLLMGALNRCRGDKKKEKHNDLRDLAMSVGIGELTDDQIQSFEKGRFDEIVLRDNTP